MKKHSSLTIASLLVALCAVAQTKFWVYSNDGTQTEFLISNVDSISFTDPSTPTPAGEKCKASDYPQVTIGTQVWMAENYRCSKYDTQSEAYNASWLKNNSIPTSDNRVYTPYYIDASDKSKWNSSEYAGNLTDAQVKKLGYLYNWAAAVGVEDGYDYGTQPFSGNRQGICPNGWHVPTMAEWQTLVDYIENTDGKGTDTAGKYLKATSGWYNGDTEYKPGLDSYGFAALPAGDADGKVCGIGTAAPIWTSTPLDFFEDSKCFARYRGIVLDKDIFFSANNDKSFGQSVRCLRN